MPQAIVAAAIWIGNAIGAAVGATLTAAGVSAAVALPLAATVANVAFFASQLALTAGLTSIIDDISHQKPAPIGQELNLRIAADVPRELYAGIRATGGSMVARYSRGSNLYNAHFAYQLADHPCVELSQVYGDGRIVQSTPLTHGVRTEITAYSYSGGPRVWMTWHDGRPGQTVDSDLVAKSALDPDVVSGQIAGWSSTHYGRGNAWIHVEVQYDSDILTSIPEFLFVIKGAKFYDRRKDTTAGGSGSHRHNDPSTWEYTTNAAVIADHYLLGYKVENDDLAFGVGLEPDEVPYATFAHLADLADEDVTTGTGLGEEVIKRYAINGMISAAQGFDDVLEQMQIQMAARIVDLGGRIGIIGAEERTPVVSLNDGDWANDESVRFADKLQFSDLYGAIAGRFSDPGNLYQPTPYERQTTTYFELPDGGEAQTAQVDMPLEIHPRRAARLASAWLNRESLQPRLAGTFATRSLAWKLEPGDWFNMSSERYQFTDELFEVVDIVKHEDFAVTLTARAIDPDFLAFSVDDDPDLSIPPEVSPFDMRLDPPTGTITAITISAGGATEPAIRFTLTDVPEPAREIAIELQEWNGSTLTGDPIPATMHSDQATIVIRNGILPTKQYKARAKVRMGARESVWTAWSSAVTASTTYTVPGSSLASAIVGQGALATLNVVSSSELAAGVGKNRLIDSLFYFGATYWQAAQGSGSSTPSTGVNSGIRYRQVVGAGLSGGSYIELNSDVGDQKLSCQVQAGDRIEASCYFGRANTSSVTLYIYWYDEAAVFKGLSTIASSAATSAGGGDISTYTRLAGFATAPTGARRAVLALQAANSTAAPTLRMAFPFIARATAAQTEATPWNPGIESQLAADVTSTNIAAGISGQAPAATDFSIQTGATKNTVTRSSTAPSSPTDGDVWVDTSTTPNVVKVRVSGAWQTASSLGGVFGSTVYEDGSGTLALLSAFKTILGTAAAFTGQGSLATLGFTTLGTNVRLADGATIATNALLVTSLGTASGITGQGSLATLNYVRLGGPVSGYAGIWNEAGNAYQTDATLITGLGTAAAITSQGGLATLNYVTIGTNLRRADGTTVAGESLIVTSLGTSSGISGQGALATQNFVLFSSTVRLADGTTVVTDAMVVTSSGTAAGISGQGNQATANAGRGNTASRPSASGSWSWYQNTETGYLQLDVPSVGWTDVANIGAAAITASASPSSINSVHTGSSFTSGTITITPSGGTSYTYSVTFNKSGGAGNVTLSATNAASFTATASLSSGQDVTGAIIVQVFDSGGKSPAAIRIPLNFSRTD